MTNNQIFKKVANYYDGDNKLNCNMKSVLVECVGWIHFNADKNYSKQMHELVEKALRARSYAGFMKIVKEIDEIACLSPTYPNVVNVGVEADDEDYELDLDMAIDLAKDVFEMADPRAVMKDADMYFSAKHGNDQMIIKFNYCEFDFVIDIDYIKGMADVKYGLHGYESQFMFGVPTMNQGYNFLTGKIETETKKMWPTEILAMVLANMVNNEYIYSFVDEACAEDDFIRLMSDPQYKVLLV